MASAYLSASASHWQPFAGLCHSVHVPSASDRSTGSPPGRLNAPHLHCVPVPAVPVPTIRSVRERHEKKKNKVKKKREAEGGPNKGAPRTRHATANCVSRYNDDRWPGLLRFSCVACPSSRPPKQGRSFDSSTAFVSINNKKHDRGHFDC